MTEEKSYRKWSSFVSEALSCLDRETLQWSFLPTKGGYYNQDEFFITIWEQIRYTYIDLKANDPDISGNKKG